MRRRLKRDKASERSDGEVLDMRRNISNKQGVSNTAFGRLAGDKKKAGIAACLIVVMAVMWVRVLTRKGPSSAQAEPAIQKTELEEQLDEATRVSFVNLPEVSGRNDQITRDFFACNGWENFKKGQQDISVDVGEVSSDGTDAGQEVVNRLAKLIRLEAIGMGDRPQAFINDKLLSEGDVFVVGDGSERYECEVVGIRRNSVVIGSGEVEFTLKLVGTAADDG